MSLNCTLPRNTVFLAFSMCSADSIPAVTRIWTGIHALEPWVLLPRQDGSTQDIRHSADTENRTPPQPTHQASWCLPWAHTSLAAPSRPATADPDAPGAASLQGHSQPALGLRTLALAADPGWILTGVSAGSLHPGHDYVL